MLQNVEVNNSTRENTHSFKAPVFWLRIGILSFLQCLAVYVLCGGIAALSELHGRRLLISKTLVFSIGIPVFLSLTLAISAFEAKLRIPIMRKYILTYFALFAVALTIVVSTLPHLTSN